MALTQIEFDALVGRLQVAAQAAPGAYQARVVLLALAGYAYLLTILVLLGALTLVFVAMLLHGEALVAIKFGVPLVILIFIVLRALWVRLPAPTGMALERRHSPRLFQAVEEIRAGTRGPQTHCILVTADFNAAVTQVPRLGLFGWPRNYLIVGLPLMQALTPAQFKAVLCHEYGHLSRGHARLGNWIYRMRLTWAKLMETLEREQHWGAFMFRRFIRWFVPYFNAYSFVLARANEYEADTCSARLCGAGVAASMLTAVAVKGQFMQRFWTGVQRRADHEAQPAYTPYALLPASYAAEITPAQARVWLEHALRETTGTADTHPALSDRLGALGQVATLEAQPEETAARHYLEGAYDKLVEELDHGWQRQIGPAWTERHRYAQESRGRLRSLEQKAQGEALGREEAHDLARLTEEFTSAEAALPLYRELVAADAADAGARFAVGRIRLARGEESGVHDLERAMELDAWTTVAGCRTILQYLHEHGRGEEGTKYRELGAQRWEKEEAARAERGVLGSGDEFMDHGLPAEDIRKLTEQLARYPDIELAYLIRKDVEHFPEAPLYVLGYRHGRFKRGKAAIEELRQRLLRELNFPGETYVIPLHGDNEAMQHVMRKIGSSVIYGDD